MGWTLFFAIYSTFWLVVACVFIYLYLKARTEGEAPRAESILRALVEWCYFDLRDWDEEPSLIVDGNAEISREDAVWLRQKLAEWSKEYQDELREAEEYRRPPSPADTRRAIEAANIVSDHGFEFRLREQERPTLGKRVYCRVFTEPIRNFKREDRG